MNVLLTNPWLWLGALITVPILAHLFARTRPPSYLFPSVEFILRVVRKTMRVKRPRDWLLLLLRTLAVAALVAVFLRPVLLAGRSGRGGSRRNLVLVVDASASMACVEGSQTRFAAACAEAAEVLSGLSARDRANLVWIKCMPEAVFPEMGVNFGHLHAELRRAAPTSEEGAVEPALHLAADLLREADGRKEICIVSDFQKTAWTRATPIAPDIELSQIRVGQSEAPNQAITRLAAEPVRPLRGEETALLCDVDNFSSQPQHRTVYLTVGESRLSQELVLPPWGRATAAFKHTFADDGDTLVTATIDNDLFSGDDERCLLVHAADHLTVGLLAADRSIADAWGRVLAALGWARVVPLRADDPAVGVGDCDILLLAGWDGRGAEPIRQRAADGALVVWSPAPRMSAAAWRTALGDGGTVPATGEGATAASSAGGGAHWEPSSTAHGLTLNAPDDRLFALFRHGEYGDPVRGRFMAAPTALPIALPADAHVLLAYDDGAPALVRLGGAPALYLWDMPLDSALSNWARQDEFVLFFAELLLDGRAGGASAVPDLDQRPGRPLLWQPGQQVALEDVRLESPDGRAISLSERLDADGLRFVSAAVSQPGVYEWRVRDRTRHRSVVNFPESESDLRTLPEAAMRADAITVSGGNRLRRLQEGIPLWPWLLAGTATVALLEGLAALWSGRVQ